MERCNLSAVMLPCPQWYQVWSLALQTLSLHLKKNFIKAPWQYRKCQSEMHCRQIEISLSLNLLLLTDVLPCLLRASNLEYLSAW